MGKAPPRAEPRKPNLAVVPVSENTSLIGNANVHFRNHKFEKLAKPIFTHVPPHENASLAYLSAMAGGSQRTIRQSLGVIAAILTSGRLSAVEIDWGRVRFAHTAAVRSKLAETCSVATANKHLSALRGVLRTAWRLGQMSAEDFHRAIDVPSIKGETIPRGRALSQGEINALFDTCGDGTFSGVRDAALIGLLYGSGLRRSEAVALDLADFDRAAGSLTIRHGKGNKARIAYLAGGADDAMSDWLGIRGEEPGPLFIPVLKGARLTFRRLSAHAIFKMLLKRADEAVVTRFSPHDLRRTFISALLDAGADISSVRALAGHANVNTTIRYDKRGERAKQTAARLIHVPYTRVAIKSSPHN